MSVHVYTILETVPLACISDWTLLLRRGLDGTNFDKDWESYKRGFRNYSAGADYWLGLEVCITIIIASVNDAVYTSCKWFTI